ncbi:hypothetical protein TIFTF001_025281 [Ficus carica]|uniref:Uncharacterized protein n=1 Tax=Ficus carica TaxID=3494 RepID=A0AA88AYP3_FICCA|nr:hypothetical protein TIFTF001_025281 [Ficus carica]
MSIRISVKLLPPIDLVSTEITSQNPEIEACRCRSFAMENHDLAAMRIATSGWESQPHDSENYDLISFCEITMIRQMARSRQSPLLPSRFLKPTNRKTASAKAFSH